MREFFANHRRSASPQPSSQQVSIRSAAIGEASCQGARRCPNYFEQGIRLPQELVKQFIELLRNDERARCLLQSDGGEMPDFVFNGALL
jgi:hypothetical protein